MNCRNYTTVNPEIFHQSACITGTRALVSAILANLVDGRGPDEISRSSPTVSRKAIRITVCYAAELASEPVVSPAG